MVPTSCRVERNVSCLVYYSTYSQNPHAVLHLLLTTRPDRAAIHPQKPSFLHTKSIKFIGPFYQSLIRFDDDHPRYLSTCPFGRMSAGKLQSETKLQSAQRIRQYPAGSGFSGNVGALRFDMQSAFQFFGVNLSTIALNASCSSTLASLYQPDEWTYQRAETVVSFQMLALLFASWNRHNFVVVSDSHKTPIELLLLFRCQLVNRFPPNAIRP